MNRNTFIFILVFFLFIGCVPKIEKVEKIDEKQIFDELKIINTKSTKENITQKWWELFEDEQLNFIVEKALNDSPSLKSVKQRFAKANATIRAIESENLPNISFESSLTRQRFSENHIFPPPLGGGYFTQYHSATTLDYKFDFWDERKSKILSAKNIAFAQKAYIENTKLNLSLAISQLYLSWNFNEKKINILEKIVNILDEEFKILKEKFDNGLIDEVLLNEKKAQISQMKYNEYSIKEITKAQISALCILSGQLPSFAQSLKKPDIHESINLVLSNDIYLNFLSNRADVAIQKYIVLSNDENINVAKTKFYPNINLSGLLGFTSFLSGEFLSKSSTVPSAGVALDLPIFDWGKRESNLDDKVITYNSSVYEYNDILNKAVNEVVGVLNKIEYKNLQIKMHKEQQISVEQNEKIANKRFEIGLNDKILYYDTKINSLMIHIVEMELLQSHSELELDLIRSIGGGFKEEELKNAKG
ncbi:MAG: TolC family protein [Arcobacter sp.]|uniref:TolC family protein n=1 Tax=Arcobacter sp. TaxID=1872629 RepID=UPI003D129478